MQPNSTVKFLSGVPLDNTYEHTLYFNSLSEQTAHFSGSYSSLTVTNYTYQRIKRGWIRVGVTADSMIIYNYMMFQNTNYSNKWFYAFVKSVEYINDNVCEIEFELDVMQTWFFNYTLGQCFVEREHPTLADSTAYCYTPESLEPGSLFPVNITDINMNDMNIAIISSPKPDSTFGSVNDIPGHTYFNTFCGASITTVFPNTALSDIKSFILQCNQNNEEIIAMYQYPRIFATPIEGSCAELTETVNRPTTLVSGYTPRNKKLYYYPFTVCRVSDHNGNIQEYPFEYFSADTAQFKIKCINIPETKVVIYPLHYKNMSEYYDENLIISDFPVCCWSNNSFEQWWASRKFGIFYEGINSALNMALENTPGLHSNPIKREVNQAQEGTQYLLKSGSEISTALHLPNKVQGNTGSACLNGGIGQQKIRIYSMSTEIHRARSIDDYFTKYGYTVNRVKVPNRNARPYFTYTKTNRCIIKGDIPYEHEQKICSIYDNGVTFWKNASDVGNYSLENGDNQQSN